MPRTETVYTVFLASPGDVKDEREGVVDVVTELNQQLRGQDIRVDLLRWEDSVRSAMGEDGQAVINEQVGEYDYFIGIMWKRVGGETKRAQSGTIEEFERAVAGKRSNNQPSEVTFYFKKGGVDPLSVDPDDLRAVQRFRKAVHKEGVLSFDFDTVEDLVRRVRQDLNRWLGELIRPAANSLKKDESPAPRRVEEDDDAATGDDEEDEPGLLELEDLAEESFNKLADAQNRLAGGVVEQASYMEEATSKLRDITERYGDLAVGGGRREARAVIDEVSQRLNKFGEDAAALEEEFRKEAADGLDAMSAYIGMVEQGAAAASDPTELATTMEDTVSQIRLLLEGIGSYVEQMDAMPRLTRELNRARRRTVSAMNAWIETLERFADRVDETRSRVLNPQPESA